MNTSATNLLRGLSTLGIRTIKFRVLSQRDARQHTTPVATLQEDVTGGHRLSRFSVRDLFEAYSLTPRKGSYVLDVEGGQLSFDPPKSRAAQLAAANAERLATKRWKPKITRRRVRGKPARAAHKLVAH